MTKNETEKIINSEIGINLFDCLTCKAKRRLINVRQNWEGTRNAFVTNV